MTDTCLHTEVASIPSSSTAGETTMGWGEGWRGWEEGVGGEGGRRDKGGGSGGWGEAQWSVVTSIRCLSQGLPCTLYLTLVLFRIVLPLHIEGLTPKTSECDCVWIQFFCLVFCDWVSN